MIIKLNSVLLILLTISIFTNAQSKEVITEYFDKDWKVLTSTENAAFYRTVEEDGSSFIVRDYFISGKIQMLAYCSSVKPKLIQEGKTTLYFENGALKEEGFFMNNDRTGLYKSFYETGATKEVIYYGKDKPRHYNYFTNEGEDLLLHGSGVTPIDTKSKVYKVYSEIQDSVVRAIYTVDIVSNDTIYNMLDEIASYKGGQVALSDDLKHHFHYPKQARKYGIEGKVLIEFVVTTDGKSSACKVLKGIDPECDQEALRIVSNLTKWNSGVHKNRRVKTRFVIPVAFKLT